MQYLKDDIKNRILESALTEFKQMGFTGASMRKIAKNAHVAIGNVYHYYKNKQELFNALVGAVYDKVMYSLNEIKKIDAKDALEYYFSLGVNDVSLVAINMMVDKLLDICKEHNTELLILLEKSGGVRNAYENTKQDLVNLLDEALKTMMLPNLIKKGKEIDNPYITYVISTSFIEGFCTILREYESGSEVRLLVDKLIRFFFKDSFDRF